MRKVNLWMSLSVDGFMDGPNRELDWHLVDDEVHTYFNDHLRRAGAFLSGRVTYEMMADFWGTADQDPSLPAPMLDFVGIWQDMPKIVYSRTLETVGDNTTVVREVVPEEVMELKSQSGGDLVLGGADLSATFLNHDLIDEFWLYIHPVILGEGKPLFAGSDRRIPLELIEHVSFGNGVVHLRYRRSR